LNWTLVGENCGHLVLYVLFSFIVHKGHGGDHMITSPFGSHETRKALFDCAILYVSGSSGAPINVISNLFKLERATNFHLFQYRVDYNPEVPSRALRFSMLKEHQDVIGNIYQFDGMMLFLPIRLEKEVHSDSCR